MICKYCGKQIPDDSIFCFYCSKAVAPTSTTIKVKGGKERVTSGGKSSSGGFSFNLGKPILIGVVILLILAVIVAVALFVLGMEIPSINADKKEPALENRNDRENSGSSSFWGGGSQSDKERPNNSVSGDEQGISESNPYRVYLEQYSSYILPYSDSDYYSYGDISRLSDDELTLAYQEIFARHGDTFTDSDLQEYFEARSWYSADTTLYGLNPYEQSNLTLIQVCQDMQSGELYRSGNPYISLYRYQDYAIASSDSRYLKEGDLNSLSENARYVVRSEILARHGCIFEDEDLQTYFYSKDWYQPSVPISHFNMNDLNRYESKNISFIDSFGEGSEYEVTNAYWSYDNPYKSIYESYGRSQVYFFADSSTRLLTRSDIAGMNIDELCLARNEIWARNGYLFGDDHLREYFQHFTWYQPTTAMGDQDAVVFNSVEYDNIRFLRARQTELENNQ